MQLFFARFDLQTTPYMGKSSIEKGVIRIIWASDEQEAEEKLLNAYVNDSYGTSYQVQHAEISEAIS